MIAISHKSRRYLAFEVIQTSAMDCGPAALKCLLEGYGIPVSYGRLREACQTDVDGTSIDTLEEVAGQLGLDAEQVMIPIDHLLMPEARALPALVVVRLPSGYTHFVVVWRRHGSLVQVMDPAVGRRWVSCARLLEEVYAHSLPVPAEDWLEWARSDEFRRPLARRLKDIGVGRRRWALIDDAARAPDWRALAALDAGTRLMTSLVRAGGVRRGREARRVLTSLVEQAGTGAPGESQVIPDEFWSALPAPAGPDGEEQVMLKGAVLIRVQGRAASDRRPEETAEALNPELAAAITEAPSRPGRDLLRILWQDGFFSLASLLAGLAIAAGGVVFEAVLFRGVMGIAGRLQLVEQRLGALGYFLVFACALLLVEWRVAGGLLRLGRLLEVRLRMDFLKKIPLLNDRYFSSRPMSDMAERSHTTHNLRLLPWLGGQLVRTVLTLVATTAAICWLDPASAVLAVAAAVAVVVVPLAFKSSLVERDLRVRTHTGALCRFYLDALVGLVAVRAHGAERPVRREHEGLLVEWARAGLGLVRSVVVLETLVALIGFGLAAALLFSHAGRGGDPAGTLLLAYWALQLPVLGDQLAMLACQYPFYRNLVLRVLEPLGAPEEMPARREEPGATREPAQSDQPGMAVSMESVTVRAAGQVILEGIEARIEPGSHVAIVGPSGAGKSSLVGLLLGWHRPASGRILMDGEPLDAERLDRLREETAWVDPSVQLWNRSMVQNLLYGEHGDESLSLGQVVELSDLDGVLPRLEDGLQTQLGGGGGLLSGGEGQRVRFGRALRRGRTRLVILDEPFRGLDRSRRQELMRRARRHWGEATVLCITHDVGETLDFDRVLVVEDGRIAEDGRPHSLADDGRSRYRALLDAERAVRDELWSRPSWRRVRLEAGQLIEEASEQAL